MFSLPLLVGEDIAALDAALASFVTESGSRLALVIDVGGFIVTKQGDVGEMDISTLGALAANNFAATQAIAKIIEEPAVSSLYQEGNESSLLILSVGDYGFMAVVFPAQTGVGSVKFYAQDAVERIGRQLAVARTREPGEGLDLAALNLADAGPLFRRRAAP